MGMSTLALDVTNAESIKTCHSEVAKITGGTLDILVNNAYVPLPPSPISTNQTLTPPQGKDTYNSRYRYRPRRRA